MTSSSADNHGRKVYFMDLKRLAGQLQPLIASNSPRRVADDRARVARTLLVAIITHFEGDVGVFCANAECRLPRGECRCPTRGALYKGEWKYYKIRATHATGQSDWCLSWEDLTRLTEEDLRVVKPAAVQTRLRELINMLRAE